MKKEFLKIGIIFFVTIAIVLWGLNFIFLNKNAPKSKAAGDTMNLSFDPATQTTTTATDFTVSIYAKPSVTTVIRGYKTRVTFDKTKLQFKSIVYKLGVVSAGIGNTDATKDDINARGSIFIVGEDQTNVGKTLTAPNGEELVTLTFTPVTNDPSVVVFAGPVFYSVNDNAVLTSAWTYETGGLSVNGGVIPSPTPTGGVNPTDGPADNAKLNLKLKFQGIGSKPPTDTLSKMKVRFRLYDENTEKYADNDSSIFTADDKGVWTGVVDFAVVPSHKYALLVKGSHHIQKRICIKNPTETDGGTYKCAKGMLALAKGDNDLDLSGIILLAGDLPVQDGTVDAYDISLVRNNIGKTDETSLAQSDINRDGKCDTQDYSLVIAALSVKSDEL
ncbi:MAG: dockerin type I domain-containing protein [Patescibacteria group bacterium]